jgi:hypothetical protein
MPNTIYDDKNGVVPRSVLKIGFLKLSCAQNARHPQNFVSSTGIFSWAKKKWLDKIHYQLNL